MEEDVKVLEIADPAKQVWNGMLALQVSLSTSSSKHFSCTSSSLSLSVLVWFSSECSFCAGES